MYQFLYTIFSTPFGYVMRFIYQFVGSYGVSIFLFALLIKVLMMPLTLKQKRSMMEVARIQPEMLKIQKTYARDQRRMQEELQNLYDREGVSPMAGCGTQLIVLPIMLGLYGVIIQPLTYFMQLTAEQISEIASRLSFEMTSYHSQIELASQIFSNFDKVADVSDKLMRVSMQFGPIDLAATPSFGTFNVLWLIPILSALTSLLMSWITQKTNPMQVNNPQTQGSNKMLMLMMPLMSAWFGFILPAGLGVYWISNNILSAAQEALLNLWMKKKLSES